MRKTLVVLVALILIGSINSYAAFPTFVWTEEYRSELYAVEMAEDGVDDTTATTDAESITAFLVFDTDEDGLSTPTDLNTVLPDEGMNIAADEENEPDSVAESITSYDIELITAGEEDIEPQQEDQEEQEG